MIRGSRLCLLLLIGITRSAGAQRATPEDLARARWNEGAHSLAMGDFEAARTSFSSAYDALPRPELAQSLGEIEYRTSHFADAVRHLTIALYNPNLTSQQRQSARQSLEKARSHVGSLFMDVDVEGADLLIDGELVGRSPLEESWALDEGEYVVGAHAKDHPDAVKKVVIVPGTTTRVSLTVRPRPLARSSSGERIASADVDATGNTSQDGRGRMIALAMGATLTALATGIGGYFLVQRSSDLAHANTLRDQLRDRTVLSPCAIPADDDRTVAGADRCEEVAKSYRLVDRDRKLATVGFVAAGMLGAATMATFLFWPRSKAPSTVRVAPWVSSGAGVMIGAEF